LEHKIDFGIQQICSQCGKGKPLNEFSRDNSKPIGRKKYCKQCQNLGNRIRRNGTEEYKKQTYLADENGKTCGKCLIKKPVTGFHRSVRSRDGFAVWCKECSSANGKNWRNKNKEKCYEVSRKNQLMRNFRITEREYIELLVKQNGECAICGASSADAAGSKLCVDHDHSTGEIRGLLCRRCNAGLGFFNDDKELVKEAASYMMETR
jgi:hypothetical protein